MRISLHHYNCGIDFERASIYTSDHDHEARSSLCPVGRQARLLGQVISMCNVFTIVIQRTAGVIIWKSSLDGAEVLSRTDGVPCSGLLSVTLLDTNPYVHALQSHGYIFIYQVPQI